MAPPGRKPKPAAQRRREGNPGKRPIKEPAFEPEGEPEPPTFLSASAREEWERVVPELVASGIAKRAHTAGLTAMCVHWGLAEDARQVIEEEGLVEAGSTGQMVQHPLIGTYVQAIGGYLKIATEFGLTPSAATRIGEGDAKGWRDPFADIGPSPRLRAVK